MDKNFKYELPDWYKKYNISGIEFPEENEQDIFEEYCENLKDIDLAPIIKEYYYKPVCGLINLISGTLNIKIDTENIDVFADYINSTYDVGNILLENLE